jgi:hypothetical protein
MNRGIIYLIQPAEFVGTNVYKFGMSHSPTLDRCNNGYKKNSLYLHIETCYNPIELEKQIKSEFDKKFKLHKGVEFFEGNEYEIYSAFTSIVVNYNLNNYKKVNAIKQNNTVTNYNLNNYKKVNAHKQKYDVNNDDDSNNICKYCNKKLANRHGRWRHEQKCKLTHNNTLENQVKTLVEKVKIFEAKPTGSNNNTNNNNNIQYIINSPTASSIDHLTFEHQKKILDKGNNWLTYLVELTNFNKTVPENHSYCVTAINDKHASVIDEKTNTIVKINKLDLFNNILGASLDNFLEILNNQTFTKKQREEYAEKINMFQDNEHVKRYQSDINLLCYNNKDMIKETWKSLKTN